MAALNAKSTMKRTYVAIGLAVLLSAGYVFALTNISPFWTLRERTADMLMRQRRYISPLPEAVKDITIVTIDEESLMRLRQRWPMSRGIYAALLKKISSDDIGPLAIGMDLFFSGASEVPEDDVLLAEAMKESGKTVIVSYADAAGTVIEPEDSLARSAYGVGFVSVPRAPDLVVRDTYPVMPLNDGRYLYSFPALIYVKSLSGKEMPAPSDQRARRINYFAMTKDFNTIPLWEALVSPSVKDLFRNKIVIVGTVVDIHHDVYPTPLGILPGVVINANIVADLVLNRALVALPPWITFLAILAGVIASGGATYRFGMLKGAAVGAGLIALAYITASVSMAYDRIFDLFGFALMVAASFTGVFIWSSLAAFIENKKLSDIAITDALTGAFTYRYFELILKGEKILPSGESAELSLLLFDIDHFKKINDTYGHGAGNDVLRGVAASISDRVPDPGAVARFGGDEFAAILPGAGSEEAQAIASGISAAVRSLAFSWLPKDAVITVSAGVVTTRHSPGSMGKELLKAADAELYKAKAAGKNNVSAANR